MTLVSESNFERREADFYRHGRRSCRCVPWRRWHTNLRPCADEGDLVRHLESFGLRCVYSGDICNGHDSWCCASSVQMKK